MTTVCVTAGALLLCLMIAITVYGWVTLPPDYRFAVPRYWPGSSYGSMTKVPALLTWPLIGAVLYGLFIIAITENVFGMRETAKGTQIVFLAVLVSTAAQDWFVISLSVRRAARLHQQEQ